MSFIPVAFAAEGAATASSQSLAFANFAPLVLIMAVFYLLLIRPQQKKFKAHQEMISKLSKGDKVVTSGGILGAIYKVEDNIVVLEVAENTKIRVRRETILEVEPSAELKVA